MNHLDPAWLHSFVAIARSGSVTAAARQVHRAQSAVSSHLRQLEGAVGTRLAERSTRSLALTAEGERFLPYAQRLLALQQEARAAVQPRADAGVLRVGISEYFLPARLDGLLAVLDDAADGRRLELLWAGSAVLRRLWQGHEVDLAVVSGVEPAPVAGSRLLRREPLAWVASPALVLPAHGPAPLVLLGPDCALRDIALAALSRTGRPHAVRLTCSGSQGAVAAIRAGWGVGCLNHAAIPADLVRLDWPSPGRLDFHLLARPAARRPGAALAAWARSGGQ
ncbi:LysR family transcriptional regulator [Ideonella sp. BN130291]|uniref:LysR family transcriptional regulator n=1 Tax=Ideonella sp. BN130291 TaxID=3112940 RepID=UPI002E25A553|nr:LysR family transcriptional regulator [Ideonella sp. BN130291]